MAELLARFVAAFKRGLDGELAAMRQSSSATEVALTEGEELGGLRYSFRAPANERLAPGTSCTLKTSRGEQRATIERVADERVAILATAAIDVAAPCALVAAPWFLYERLATALEALTETPLALELFGKSTPSRVESALVRDHGGLDDSQRAAVQLCADSSLAFVWGPPGTGKTTTLVGILDELLARGERVLLASTTNAAIDQILAKVSPLPWFAPGVFVRLGRSDADTFGTELGELVAQRDGARKDEVGKLRRRIGEVDILLRFARARAAELAPVRSAQVSLFDAAPTAAQRREAAALDTRIARLDKVRVLAKARIAKRMEEDRDIEGTIVGGARVVLCTLTNAYLSPAMAGQRFDALIGEEAGMATLPALFYAASLCARRAIMVGDPRQLPPIVQSDDEVVRRAIGRNIFDVVVPEPSDSALVAMLDVQYRMHPAIGSLVGALFYGGRLVHRASGCEEIAARAPFPGRAVVVDDLVSECVRSTKGSSRVNARSAERTADLAQEAVRAGAGAVAVITPYAAQASDIRRLLTARRLGDAVECSTIHRFQGRECDVVILDLVDAAPMRPSALVGEAPNLLNVSISRARGKLVIVADVAYWRSASPDGLVARLLREAAR